eukprot:14514776-Alexandrium_andersonii.AAC.1
MSTAYRTWAKLRLRHMKAWQQSWACSEHFAGVAGVGAQDAWFSASAAAEVCHLEGAPYAMTLLDLFKAFDQ